MKNGHFSTQKSSKIDFKSIKIPLEVGENVFLVKNNKTRYTFLKRLYMFPWIM